MMISRRLLRAPLLAPPSVDGVLCAHRGGLKPRSRNLAVRSGMPGAV